MLISSVEDELKKYAGSEVARLRGSVGEAQVYQCVMATLPQMQACAEFISHCRVISASLALHAGDFPVVRVKLRSGKVTRTVSPSRWIADLICSFGTNEYEEFAQHLRKTVSKDWMQTIESLMAEKTQKLLSDETLVNGMRGKLRMKKVLERDRQIKIVVQTFRSVPHDLLTEEEIIRLWRENQVRHVLES